MDAMNNLFFLCKSIVHLISTRLQYHWQHTYLYIQIQEEANRAHEMAVTSLEDTVRSLEQKCIDAEENNINLKKEMEELRELEKASIKKKGEISHKSTQTTLETLNKEIQTALENEGKKKKLLQ